MVSDLFCRRVRKIKLFYNKVLSLLFRATVTEEEIREAFTKEEFEVKAFKFFP